MSALLRRKTHQGGTLPTVEVTPHDAGWQYLAFRAYRLEPGESIAGETGEYETGIVVLGGSCSVAAGGQEFFEIGERPDVWAGRPPYVVVMPPGVAYQVKAESHAHIAVAGAKATDCKPHPVRLITPDEIHVEERGEGNTYRRVQHLLPPSAESARLQLVEVYTPAGNWSSFPPHKHDTEDPPREAYLEEIYYYQIKPEEGFALQRIYTDDQTLDEAVAAYSGDVVLVPRGYHPVAAMPGYDCYYLNAMAGPSKAWNFTVDPRYAWLMNWTKPQVTEVGGGD